jgi:hypothetical protein
MTKRKKFKKDDILVCIKTQRYGCGAMKLRKGALVKAEEDEDYDMISIFRAKRDEDKRWKAFSVEVEKMRLATSDEVAWYEQGIRII